MTSEVQSPKKRSRLEVDGEPETEVATGTETETGLEVEVETEGGAASAGVVEEEAPVTTYVQVVTGEYGECNPGLLESLLVPLTEAFKARVREELSKQLCHKMYASKKRVSGAPVSAVDVGLSMFEELARVLTSEEWQRAVAQSISCVQVELFENDSSGTVSVMGGRRDLVLAVWAKLVDMSTSNALVFGGLLHVLCSVVHDVAGRASLGILENELALPADVRVVGGTVMLCKNIV